MITKDFSLESLSSAIRKKDEPHYPFVRDALYKTGYLKYLSNRIKTDSFDFKKLVKKSIRKFLVYRTQKLGDELVLRQLCDALKRSYRIKPTNRSEIVKQSSVILQDSTNKHIFRLDITKFYESINRHLLLEKISKERKISYLAIRYLSKFFALLDEMNIEGLPRGLAISATLSEIYLSDFDDSVRRVHGVYYYGRYVDDMILFTVNPPEVINNEISKLLPEGMVLNAVKSKSFSVKCRCIPNCLHHPHACPCVGKCKCEVDLLKHQLDFLGYELQFSDVLGKKLDKPQKVRIELSKKKINKIKYRMIHSVIAFITSSDFVLFKKRIGFLTSNRRLRKLGARGKLKAGIYYNHPLLTDAEILKELDLFFRRIMHSKNSKIGKLLGSKITPAQKTELLKLTFLSGYSSRRTTRITTGDVALIKKCWNHG